MRSIVVGMLLIGALVATTPAQAAERVFGATAEELASPTPAEGAADCSAGCFFASEPQHGPLQWAILQPPDEAARFPLRLNWLDVLLQDPGSYHLSLLVLTRPQSNRFFVKRRVDLALHDGPGLVMIRADAFGDPVEADEDDWVGLHVVHSGQTRMIQGLPGSVSRLIGTDPQEGDTIETDPTFGKNKRLPMRIYAEDELVPGPAPPPGEAPPPGAGAPGGGAPPPPGGPLADLSVTELVTPNQVVGRVYDVKVLVKNNGPDVAADVRSDHFEPFNAVPVRLGSYSLAIFRKSGPSAGPFPCQRSMVLFAAYSCGIGALAPGQTAIIEIRSAALRTGEGMSGSEAKSSLTPDPNPNDNGADSVVRIRGACDDSHPILGSAGDDRLAGTLGADLMIALYGHDRMRGRAGNDCMFGEHDRDRLDGGAGNDLMDGGDHADRLDGRGGDDELNGREGKDVLNGGRGDDRIAGHEARDRLSGGPGDDRLDAADGAGGDRITCGGGEDTVTADRGDRVARDCETRRRAG